MARSSNHKKPHSKKKRALKGPDRAVKSEFEITQGTYLGRKRGLKVPNKTIKNRHLD